MTFQTTRWSIVVGAGSPDPAGRRALGELCQAYWYPLYAYARRKGLDRATAEDRTQGFFVTLLERSFLGDADPEKGRFRTYLRVAFDRYLINAFQRDRAEKRGGGRTLSLDFESGERQFQSEPIDEDTPDRLFERRFARAVIDLALIALEGEFSARGQAQRHQALRPLLLADDATALADVSRELGMSDGAVRVALHRMRARFRQCLRAEVAETVTDSASVDDELQELMLAL